MIPRDWHIRPFTPGLSEVERTAGLRVLRTIVTLRCGDRGRVAARALYLAETNPDAMELAVGALERLPSLDRRGVLASYQQILRAP